MLDIQTNNEIPDDIIILGDFQALKHSLWREGLTIADVEKLTPDQIKRLVTPFAQVVKIKGNESSRTSLQQH